MSSNNGSKKSEEFASNQEEELGKQGEKQFHSETLTENRENRDYSNFPMEIESASDQDIDADDREGEQNEENSFGIRTSSGCIQGASDSCTALDKVVTTEGAPSQGISVADDLTKQRLRTLGQPVCCSGESPAGPKVRLELIEKERVTSSSVLNPIVSCNFHPDSSHLVTGSEFGQIDVWSLSSHGIVKTFPGHKDRVTGCVFIAAAILNCFNGAVIASCSLDATVKVWSDSNEPIADFPFGSEEDEELNAIAFHPSGLFVASSDSCFYHLDLESQTALRKDEHSIAVKSIAVDNTGNFVLTGGKDGIARVSDMRTELSVMFLTFLHPHEGSIRAVDFSPNGNDVITGGSDKSIKFWDIRNKKMSKNILQAHEAKVSGLKYQKIDGRYIVSSSKDGVVKAWSKEGVEKVAVPLDSGVSSLDISSDARYICATSFDGTFTICPTF